MSHPRLFTYSSRLNSFRARPDLFAWPHGPHDIADLVQRASTVKGLDSLMLNYPEHFSAYSVEALGEIVAKTHLTVSGINLRYPDSAFSIGSFTHPVAGKRQEAIQLTCAAADACRRLGAKHLVIWLAPDGFDYPFQLDYAEAWTWTIEGIKAVAAYAADLKVSIEYKPAEPRRFSLLGDLGTTLLAVAEGGMPNLGVTLDFCHLLMAKEHPPMSAALCLQRGQLYGLHLNDGYGSLDDGLMVGTVNLPQTLELLYYLLRANYDEVIYFDTFPTHEDPVQECAHNIERVNRMVEVIGRLDDLALQNALSQQDGLHTTQLLWEAMFPA